jgi:hypothetical protein
MKSIARDGLVTDAEVTMLLGQAHYHLGRLLYQHDLGIDRAVSELEEAVQLNPDSIPAFYYLGQAIHQQIRQNRLRRAEEAFRVYLSGGAPLGDEEGVRRLMGARIGPGA